MEISGIIVRRATPDDAAGMSAYLNTLAAEGLDTISSPRYSTEEESAFLQKAASKERAFFLLALDGPLVVGMLDLWAGEKPSDKHAGRLGMSVLRPYRRTGIGRKLLETAIREAKDWDGFCRIELDVVPWNEAAIRLYESTGFTHEGTKRNACKFRSAPHDLALMALVW